MAVIAEALRCPVDAWCAALTTFVCRERIAHIEPEKRVATGHVAPQDAALQLVSRKFSVPFWRRTRRVCVQSLRCTCPRQQKVEHFRAARAARASKRRRRRPWGATYTDQAWQTQMARNPPATNASPPAFTAPLPKLRTSACRLDRQLPS